MLPYEMLDMTCFHGTNNGKDTDFPYLSENNEQDELMCSLMPGKGRQLSQSPQSSDESVGLSTMETGVQPPAMPPGAPWL